MSLVFFAGLFGVLTTLLWLVIGWRAMRAHERIADALSAEPARRPPRDSSRSQRKDDAPSFRQFLDEDPLAKHLDHTEQLRRYAEWKNRKHGSAGD